MEKNQVLFNDLSLEIEQGEFVWPHWKKRRRKNNTSKYNRTDYRYIGGNDKRLAITKNLSMKSKNAMLLRRHTIGYLFQNYGLVEDESVLWNLKLALEYRKMSKGEKLRKINKYLKQFWFK